MGLSKRAKESASPGPEPNPVTPSAWSACRASSVALVCSRASFAKETDPTVNPSPARNFLRLRVRSSSFSKPIGDKPRNHVRPQEPEIARLLVNNHDRLVPGPPYELVEVAEPELDHKIAIRAFLPAFNPETLLHKGPSQKVPHLRLSARLIISGIGGGPDYPADD